MTTRTREVTAKLDPLEAIAYRLAAARTGLEHLRRGLLPVAALSDEERPRISDVYEGAAGTPANRQLKRARYLLKVARNAALRLWGIRLALREGRSPDEGRSLSPPRARLLTYGTLPPREHFDAAFERVRPEGFFGVLNDRWAGSGAYSCGELWSKLEKAIDTSEDGADRFASDVLSVLGWEWV